MGDGVEFYRAPHTASTKDDATEVAASARNEQQNTARSDSFLAGPENEIDDKRKAPKGLPCGRKIFRYGFPTLVD